MKITKESRRQARTLFRHCFTDTELDDGKVRAVMQHLIATKPRHFLAVLQTLAQLIRLEVVRRSALVQSATPLEPALTRAVTEGLEENYGRLREINFQVNPGLIGGLRIQVGSDVWDGSVSRRLRVLHDAL